jgi:hypothetical protein
VRGEFRSSVWGAWCAILHVFLGYFPEAVGVSAFPEFSTIFQFQFSDSLRRNCLWYQGRDCQFCSLSTFTSPLRSCEKGIENRISKREFKEE